jgi:hypothetical protein
MTPVYLGAGDGMAAVVRRANGEGCVVNFRAGALQ